jgi:hypothetical protein
MRAPALAAALGSFVLGMVLVRGAPPAWRLDPWQGLLLGTALYMGVVHRWLAWRRVRAIADSAARRSVLSDAWDLGWRLAFFLGLVAGEAYAYFEWLPPADLRAPFVMLSGWVVAESLLAPRGSDDPVSAASRRA